MQFIKRFTAATLAVFTYACGVVILLDLTSEASFHRVAVAGISGAIFVWCSIFFVMGRMENE